MDTHTQRQDEFDWCTEAKGDVPEKDVTESYKKLPRSSWEKVPFALPSKKQLAKKVQKLKAKLLSKRYPRSGERAMRMKQNATLTKTYSSKRYQKTATGTNGRTRICILRCGSLRRRRMLY